MARGVGGRFPSNVRSYLKGVAYPASKLGGPQEVIKAYGEQQH
jgi:hypothetical protein